MPYRKHNWIQYGRKGEMVEITIRDVNGAKLDFFRCNNKKEYPRIIKIINDKYGFPSTVSPKVASDILKEQKEWLSED